MGPSAPAPKGGVGDARSGSDEDEGEGDSERGAWKKYRTLSTMDRARFGGAPFRRKDVTSDGRSVPFGESPGTGIGKGESSTGLGRVDDTEEQCEASGGESRDSASGLRTCGPLVCRSRSAFI